MNARPRTPDRQLVARTHEISPHGALVAKTLGAPHFIGIGAPRCGTTWVYKMLRLHPEVWIPWKEIHFFDSLDADTPSGFDIRSRAFRLRQSWRSVFPRLAINSIPAGQRIVRRAFPLRAAHSPGNRWTSRYLLGAVTPDWYEGLFREGKDAGLCCGEITPAYSMLSAPAIEEIARLLPRVRTFLLLRHPLQWAWSCVCQRIRKEGGDPADFSENELIARCPVPNGRSRADFGDNLRRWIEHFPRDRLLIDFHDSIRNEPEAFLARLCTHLGIGPFASERRALLSETINSSARAAPIPKGLERYAAERFVGEARAIAELVGGPAEAWLEEIESVHP